MRAVKSVTDSNGSLEILVVRPDRLGDVILSTPVFETIKRNYPQSRLTVMVSEAVASVIRGLECVDEVMIFDPTGKHSGFAGFFRLLAEIKAHRFRIAVLLQSQRRIAFALFFARIKYRVGPLSKMHSFFLLNRGLRQRRSQVEMHEADYNLQLLRRIGIRAGSRRVPTQVHISEEARRAARIFLEAKGWNESDKLIAVHPGMGGSALNWPEHHYIEFVRALLKEGHKVILTGGPSEGTLLNRISDSLGELSEKFWIYGGVGVGSIENLGGIFSFASLVVAPSTGPLHLAVALGKPVVTFYPPVRVQSALRWGPYLADEKRARVLVPEVFCGQDFDCRGSLCNYYPCMKSLTVDQAIQQAKTALSLDEKVHP